MYGPYMPRLEIRLSEDEARRLDQMRGDVPKGTFVKRQLGLDTPPTAGKALEELRARTARELDALADRPAETPLPKIAPRRWLG